MYFRPTPAPSSFVLPLSLVLPLFLSYFNILCCVILLSACHAQHNATHNSQRRRLLSGTVIVTSSSPVNANQPAAFGRIGRRHSPVANYRNARHEYLPLMDASLWPTLPRWLKEMPLINSALCATCNSGALAPHPCLRSPVATSGAAFC